ncbi:MAG: Calx-beta domain-containing protein [Isosphaeraceae bacterium]|nr:Calx-beta domain-containing protein [Isosphaeraceae bacterium]
MTRTGDQSRRNLELRRRRALAPWAEALEARQLLATFVVNSTADSPAAGTLRWAINQVNADASDSPSAPDAIEFALTPQSGTLATITLLSPLPEITNPVVIDGYSQAGSSTNSTSNPASAETDVAVINVQVDAPGVSPTPGLPGLFTVAAANTTIDGLSITSFNGPAIALLPPPSSPNGSVGDNIWGNFIGVATFDPNSFNDLPVDPSTSTPSLWTHINPLGNSEGILVQSSNNRIGGTLPPDRNIIQGNHGDGVQLAAATGTGNLVEGNFILDNDANGVDITTSNNLVGEAIGQGPGGGGNVISGNNYGVAIVGPTASGNILVNNEIGTQVGLENVTPPIRGMNPRPNRFDGVLIQDAPSNVVGGLLSNSRNVIAANGLDGVSIQNAVTQDATGNVVQGNYVGYNLRNGIIAILPNRDGINISSANNTIGGTTAAARNEIASNARNGITISSMSLDSNNLNPVPIPNADPTGNFIAGNYIGTEGGGDDYGNTLDGILIEDASGNSVGGTVAGAQNVISGNNDGVVINDDTTNHLASTGNVVSGNNIGLMSDNTTPLPNSIDGVLIANAAKNTIGGTVTAAANLLSGNNNGLELSGAGATGNVVIGNFVGTDITGTIAARNSVDGILVDSGASSNTIGGTSAATRNIISGNNTGVVITGPSSTGNVISGDYIGLAVGGTTALPNAVDGVRIAAPGNMVGGTVAGAANVVSGNFVGVYLTGANATGNTVEGNLIGTDATGANAVRNTSDGVTIDAGATGNTIGGVAGAAANVIANNGGNGVDVVSGTGNSILSNQIYANGLLGISGSNGLLSAFTLTSVSSNSVSTVIQGQFTSTSQATFLFQFFVNPANASPSYNYEGRTLITSQNESSNGTSATTFTITIPTALTAGQYVTFTGTGPDHTTSEFSAGVPVSSATQPLVYTVTNTNDSGPGSLRAAIEAVNLAPSPLPTFNDKIVFAIPGTGQQTINLLAPLPVILNPVAIEGYTQPGSTPNSPQITTQTGQSSGGSSSLGTTSTSGAGLNSVTTSVSATGAVTITTVNASNFNAVINVRLDGSNAVPIPGQTLGLLTIASLNCQVSGLSITGYMGGPGLLLEPGATTNYGGIGDTIFGNIIGEASFVATNNNITPPTNPLGNLAGIVVESPNNVIGGQVLNIGIPPLASQGSLLPPATGANVIQGNNGPGIVIQGEHGTGTVVQADFVLDNQKDGVLINTSNNFVGQTLAGLGNVISGNGWNGVEVSDIDMFGFIAGTPAQGNVVVDNLIGTNGDGATARPNLRNGVLILDSPGNVIGGLNSLSPNVIGSNALDGISIQNGSAQDAVGNMIEGNDIGFNPNVSQIAILPNRDGISISAANNTVGGTTTGANKIAYNWRNGVTISSADLSAQNDTPTAIPYANPTGNVVEGNLIGTIDGMQDSGNTLDGILIEDAGGNTVGGTTSGARNVISGNNRGVVINDDTTNHLASTANLIEGNDIGPMADGVTVLNNAVDGVRIDNAANNTIGGTTAAAANVISGNNTGVHFTGANATGNLVEGNFIGTDKTGTLAVRNSIDGVLFDDNASNNTIGGTATGAGNTIAFNVGSGVKVISGTGDSILSNSIFSNERIGIDLVAPGDPANGVTPNHAAPTAGPNDLVNYPVLTSVSAAPYVGSTATVSGTYTGLAGASYLLQFFSNSAVDASGYGQGKTLLGSQTITLPGSATPGTFVTASFSAAVSGTVQFGQYVTATATALSSSPNVLHAGSTSEFSKAVQLLAEIQFSQSTYTAYANGGLATITVTRDTITGTATVHYATGGGTAQPGVDYTPVAGTLTFSPGQTNQTFTIPIANLQLTSSLTVGLTLSDPTGLATLGARATATLSINPTAQTSGGGGSGGGGSTGGGGGGTVPVLPPSAAPGPVITNFVLQTSGPAITGIVLTFNEALDPTRAQNLGNFGYYILSAGADNVFGTRDDGSVLIASAQYNSATFQVVLTPAVPLSLGRLYKIGINTQASVPLQTGLTDTAGNLLDGAYNGQSGTPYVAEFEFGSQLQYTDGSGNRVSLQLARGGVMSLQLTGNGNAEVLQIVGPVPGKSVLSGQVRGPRRPSTTIPVIEGARGVRVRLHPPAFHIGHISAAAVDALLAKQGRR